MTPNPYAVPLAALVDGAHVVQDDQVTEQAVPRLQHLPGSPELWAAAGGSTAAGGGGGCASGGGADGDC